MFKIVWVVDKLSWGDLIEDITVVLNDIGTTNDGCKK